MKRHPAKQVLFMLPALALLAVGSASVEAPQEQSAPQAEGEAQPECKHSRMRCDARIVLRGVDALLLRLLEAEATHGEDAGKARAKNREAKVEAKQLKEPKEQGTRALSGKGLAGARPIGNRCGSSNALAALNGKLYKIGGFYDEVLWEVSPRKWLSGRLLIDWLFHSGVCPSSETEEISLLRQSGWLSGWLFGVRQIGGTSDEEVGEVWSSPRALAALNGKLYAIDGVRDVLWEFSPQEGLNGASARQIGGSRAGGWNSLAALNGKLYAIDSVRGVLWEFSPQEGLNGASARQIGGSRKIDGNRWLEWGSLAALNGKLYAIRSAARNYRLVRALWEFSPQEGLNGASARQVGGSYAVAEHSLAALNGKLYTIVGLGHNLGAFLLEFSPQEGLDGVSARYVGGGRKGEGRHGGIWSSLAALNGKLYVIEASGDVLLEFSPQEGLDGVSARYVGGSRKGGGRRAGIWSSLAALNGKLYAIEAHGEVLWEFSSQEGLNGRSARQIGGRRAGGWYSLAALNGKLYAIEAHGEVLWEFSSQEGLNGRSARQIGGRRAGGWHSLAALNGKLYAIDSVRDVLWEFSPQEGLDGGSARQVGGSRAGAWASLAALSGKLYAIDNSSRRIDGGGCGWFDDGPCYRGVLWGID